MEDEAIEQLKIFPEWNRDDQWLRSDRMEELVNFCTKDLEEIQKYRAIGTVEELREARERQMAKKPGKKQVGRNILMSKIYYCPTCNNKLYDCAIRNGKLDYVSPGSRKSKFCEDCGQKLDWSE